MKRKITGFLLTAALISTISVAAQSGDLFNSRTGIALTGVKGYLQNHCWAFPGFDINKNGWIPAIEGDGAMVSGSPANNPIQGNGIYSPLLDIPGQFSIAFKYKFNGALQPNTHRRLVISLTSAQNDIIQTLDSIEFTAIDPSAIPTYNKTFSQVPKGAFRVYLNYQGNNGDTRIAIDDLYMSAAPHYASGCNAAPLAVNDRIGGQVNRTAAGNVLLNDLDANHDALNAYLISPSHDGSVSLEKNGSFTFTPNANFNGSSTSFTYKVCDGAEGSLCSLDATVTIQFPPISSMKHVGLTDFKGLYQNDGRVELSWAATAQKDNDHFDVERSFDGYRWEKAGTQPAEKEQAAYSFVDKVSRNTASKKDLYYRLKQVDAEGNTAYSRLLVVRVYNTRSLKMVSVTPHPALNDIAVNVQLNERSYVVMKVLDGSGSEIMRKALNADEGANSYLMDGTNKLQPGPYSLEVTVNSRERMNVKLLKE